MSALGNVGTANLTTVLIKEEPSFAGAITTATSVWLRKNRAFFQRVPNIVPSDYANAYQPGIAKEVFHTTAGLLAFEMDCTTIGWLLKWFMGSKTSTIQGATSEYKHVFKPGITLKSSKVFTDLGGLSSALNEDFKGQAPDRLAFIANILETVKGESVFLGQTDESGAGPGAATYAEDNLTVAHGNVSYYIGTAGEATIAGMTRWNDPYYMRLDMARNRKVDNFISDGTGKSSGITDGVLNATVNLITTLTTNNKYSTFRSGTEVAFGCRLDTNVAIPSGNGSNYKLDIIIPRCKISNYDVNADGIGTILPAVNLMPMKDPALAYALSFELFNNTTTYADAT